jgi:hypothetical protein
LLADDTVAVIPIIRGAIAMLRQAAVIGMVMFCALSVAADDAKPVEKPQLPAAVAALREYDKSAEVAEKAYKEARLAAEHKLIDKLKPAMAIATKAANLPEANAIDAQIKLAMFRIDELLGKGKATQLGYSLWQFVYPGGSMKDWLLTDGTLVNARGEKGKWTKEGSTVVLDHNGPKDRLTLSSDGKKLSGESFGNPLRATLIGTDSTGADPPPDH